MAAGLGFKTFTTGEVLTAADTNGYLMQGVLVFATAAARNAAITSPQEGQFAFTKDTNGLWYYDGAAWVASGAAGDIEGVTAGVGISGGGTSGTVTVTNSMATEITAAGDIIVGTGSGTFDNLPIGTTAQVLTADTTVSPYKVKWATLAAASSALTLVASSDFTTSTSIVVNNCFSATYKNYLILCDFTATSNNGDFNLLFRVSGTNSTTGYNFNVMKATGTTVSATQSVNAGSFAIGEFSSSYGGNAAYEVILFEPFIAVSTKSVTRSHYTTTAGNRFIDVRSLDHDGQTSYDGFNLTPALGNVTGNIRVYGYALT